jgi:predicted small metal-binding protein
MERNEDMKNMKGYTLICNCGWQVQAKMKDAHGLVKEFLRHLRQQHTLEYHLLNEKYEKTLKRKGFEITKRK